MRFSARYARKFNQHHLVLEDAPKATRIGYIKGVLPEFVSDSGSYSRRKETLDAYETHKKFCALIRDVADPWDYDHESSWEALKSHLMNCTWLEFYDFVELLGKLLLDVDDPFASSKQLWFNVYQARVNSLLEEDNIGWTLNESAELYRQVPKVLARRVKAAVSVLTDQYAAAREHYQKSMTYLYQHPIDEANAIKEIVSALESVTKVLAPGSSTLGDAIKTLSKRPSLPKHLMDSVEKLSIYSNATPMVRHGHITTERITVAEAELAVHIGIAFIRYLIETEANLRRMC